MSDDFDPTPYVRPPVLDVASGVALGVALLHALPKEAPDGVRKAARRLRQTTVDLQEAWAASGRSMPGSKGPADVRVDKAWAALHARLESYAALPWDEYPMARRAAELVDLVYPDGLQFLTLPYKVEWAEGEKRLRQIVEGELSEDINAIAGPEFLAEVRKAHTLYGEALGVTRPEGGEPVNLVDPLRALGKAITQYSLQVIAMDDETQASVEAIKTALQPIDEHRTDTTRRAAKGDPGSSATLATTVPEVPEVPQ